MPNCFKKEESIVIWSICNRFKEKSMEEKDHREEIPPIPEEKKAQATEKEWAERLGLEYVENPEPEEVPPGEDSIPPAETVPPPVISAPAPPTREPMPPSYMIWAVLSTLCCCMPAGIVAIVFSASVSTKYFSGDIEGARRASHRVEIWVIVSIVAGIIFNALYAPLSLLWSA